MIVQSDDLPLSTVLVAPTSTSARETSFRPRIDVAGVQTLILAEQTVAADFSRLGERVGRLSRRELDELEKALRTVLALD